MKDYTSDTPVWSDSIPIVEQNDLVNAENDSAAAKHLLQNILVLRAMMVMKEEGKSLVSDAERNLWNMIYEQATGYTDQKIADLINGAPSTLDTLGEIAAAMGDNADVVEALEAAIGNKANQTEMESLLGTKLDKTGDTKNNIVTFASSDTTTPSGWTEVATLQSSETHKSFLQKISTMFKNVRYIWKLIGTSDISDIGDGTLTGAVCELNTGINVHYNPDTDMIQIYYNGEWIDWKLAGVQFDGYLFRNGTYQILSGFDVTWGTQNANSQGYCNFGDTIDVKTYMNGDGFNPSLHKYMAPTITSKETVNMSRFTKLEMSYSGHISASGHYIDVTMSLKNNGTQETVRISSTAVSTGKLTINLPENIEDFIVISVSLPKVGTSYNTDFYGYCNISSIKLI